MDDFLFISTEKRDVLDFHRKMSLGTVVDLCDSTSCLTGRTGFPEFGSFISRDKTLANFKDDELDGVKCAEADNPDFPWCGLLIDMKTLNVKSDYSKFTQGSMFLFTLASNPILMFGQESRIR